MSTSTSLSVNQKGFAHLFLVIVIFLIVVIAIGAFLITKNTKLLPKASIIGSTQTQSQTSASSDEPQVSLKTEYENPFDETSSYQNPFESYQNPFESL